METIIRVIKDYAADPFARIDKIPLNDPAISYKAKGILSYILSKPDGWQVNVKDLEKHGTDQDKSIRSGLRELELNQYARRFKIIDARTKRIIKWVYQIHERPYPGDLSAIETIEFNPHTQNGELAKKPDSRFPHLEKPHLEKPHLEKDPPINKVFKQLINQVTKEDNNNNAVVIPDNEIEDYKLLELRVLALGWIGETTEIKKYYLKDKTYLMDHIEKASAAAAAGLKNPAGLLRKNLRSGVKVHPKKNNQKQDYLDDPYAEFIEA